MVVLKTQVFYDGNTALPNEHFRCFTDFNTLLGAVPQTLTNFHARRIEDDSRPNKRRKVTSPQNLAQVNGQSEFKIPLGYIPIARFILDLVSLLSDSFQKLLADYRSR